MNSIGGFLRSESGATAIEYGLIAGLVALSIIVGAQLSGNGLDQMFQVIGFKMQHASDAAGNSTGN